MNNPRSSHTLLQVAQGNAEGKTCKRVCLPYPDKLFSKNFQPFKKIKNTPRTGDTNGKLHNLTGELKLLTGKHFMTRRTEGHPLTAVWQKRGCSASYDNFSYN